MLFLLPLHFFHHRGDFFLYRISKLALASLLSSRLLSAPCPPLPSPPSPLCSLPPSRFYLLSALSSFLAPSSSLLSLVPRSLSLACLSLSSFLPSAGAEFARRTWAKAPSSPFVRWKRLWGFQRSGLQPEEGVSCRVRPLEKPP